MKLRIVGGALDLSFALLWFALAAGSVWAGTITPTPTPTVAGVPLGHFVGYQAKVAKSGPKFFKLGPVTLADPTFTFTADYDVLKPNLLALPANKNGEGFTDTATHLVAYAVKLAKGSAKFRPRADVRVSNQCGDLVVTAKKPVSVLVPTGVDGAAPAPPAVDHFLCYQAKAQKKLANGTPLPPFPKGVQADVTDAFQSRRYDLKKVASVCLPVAKSGSPQLLAGPNKGTQFVLEPTTVGNPESLLVCYQAKLATKNIPQNGCGAVDPADKGAKIVPKQPTHVPRRVEIGNQLGGGALDTKKESLVCIPSAHFAVGAAATVTTLDSDGRFPTAITLTTDHGVTAHLDAGTQVHGLDGEVVTGDVDIVLDDGGGVAAFGGPDPIQAIVRLLVRRHSDGAALRVDFDPPVKVDLEVGDLKVPGTWLVYTYADSDGFLVIGPGAGVEQVLVGPLDVNDDGPEQLVFANTTVMGLGFVADPASTHAASRALADVPSTVSVAFPLPGDPPEAFDPSARICVWRVEVPTTAEIVIVDLFVQQPPVPLTGPGFGLGESRKKTIRGRTYTAKLVDRGGGQHALEVTSVFHDRFFLDFELCIPPDGLQRADIARDAQGGCADETCTDVRYDGMIIVDVTTGSSSTSSAAAIGDIFKVRDTLQAVTGAGKKVLVALIHHQPNGQYFARIRVLNEDRSTQTIAALLPDEWIKSATDRRLAIQVLPNNPITSYIATIRGGTDAECDGDSDNVVDSHDDNPSPTTGSGPFDVTLASNPQAASASCSAGHASDTTSGTLTTRGSIDGSTFVLTLTQSSTGTTTAQAAFTGGSQDPGCVDPGDAVSSDTTVRLTFGAAHSFTFTGSLSGTQTSQTVYSLVRVSPDTAIIFSPDGSLTPSFSGTLPAGTYEYETRARVFTNGIHCQDTKTVTDTFTYNFELKVQP